MLAQQSPLPVVDFDCPNCLPADALVQLSRQTGINIVFNDRFFSRCPPANFQAHREPLTKVVERLSACAHVSFKVIDNQIIFFRKAQKYTLSGYVQDAESGERLIGATLRVLDGKEGGAVTNEFGFFSGRFEEGELRLRVTMVGYQPQILPLSLDADRLLIIKIRADLTLPEVTVMPELEDSVHHRTLGSPGNFRPRDLRATPMPGGEKDLLRQTALQTGVQTGVDGLGGLHVRGGNADQNLVLLDDVPVYNPSHALGLFSIFNPNTISNVRLWKGDFPARYGGRVSSVLDVRTREGNLRQFHANGSLGLFAASLTAEGPIVTDKVSFLIGLR
ncbi:MAG: carboxypeptidase-like regulatory domain-containing protein, partial [Saprospiraceae bacterium]